MLDQRKLTCRERRYVFSPGIGQSGGTHKHGDELLPADVGCGIKVGGICALGDVVLRADSHVLDRVERISTGTGKDVHEWADLIARDSEPKGLHHHLGELLSGHRIRWIEPAVALAIDDVPGGQIADCCVVGMVGRNVGERRSNRESW